MSKSRLLKLAERWKPRDGDPDGEDQRRLIEYLLERSASWSNPVTIETVLEEAGFENSYSRSAFQHRLLGPLRKRRDIFVGTGNGGIFLVTTPEDADQTLGFYTTRVRQELRHARNLRNLARRTKLFEGYTPAADPKKPRAIIFIDESGTPTTADLKPPVFVVAAVVIESREELAALEQRFRNACAIIKRPVDHELRTSGLSAAKHRQVLRELSLIDYQWAGACFIKPALTSPSFTDAKTFYKYALQFLVGELLTVAWQADLVIDEYSTKVFQGELESYLRDQNSGLPVSRLDKVSFAISSKERLVQLSDLVAGAVRRATEGERGPLDQLGDKNDRSPVLAATNVRAQTPTLVRVRCRSTLRTHAQAPCRDPADRS
jgi:hypothetical protein